MRQNLQYLSRTTPWLKSLCWLVIVIACTGCGTTESLPYTIFDNANGEVNVVLNNSLRIVVHGSSYGSGQAEGQIMIAGLGGQDATLTSGDFTMSIHYSEGAAELKIDKHVITLRKKATEIYCGDQTFDIKNNEHTTLMITEDGSAALAGVTE